MQAAARAFAHTLRTDGRKRDPRCAIRHRCTDHIGCGNESGARDGFDPAGGRPVVAPLLPAPLGRDAAPTRQGFRRSKYRAAAAASCQARRACRAASRHAVRSTGRCRYRRQHVTRACTATGAAVARRYRRHRLPPGIPAPNPVSSRPKPAVAGVCRPYMNCRPTCPACLNRQGRCQYQAPLPPSHPPRRLRRCRADHCRRLTIADERRYRQPASRR